MAATDDLMMPEKNPECNASHGHENCTTDEILESPMPEAIIVPCVFSVILIVGLIGNLLLILSFAQHKSLTTTHNVLVVNLASGDFIFLIVSLPFNSMFYTLSHWPFGLVMCKLSFFAESLSTAVVITTLSVLSIERCLIVTGKKLWRQQRKEPILLTLGVWAFAIFVSLPTLMSANLNEKYAKTPLCSIYDLKWGMLYARVHIILRFIVLFCLPLMVIAVAYVVIAIHLLLKAFPLSERSNKPNTNSHQVLNSHENNKKNNKKADLNTSPNHQSEAETKVGNKDFGNKSNECLINKNKNENQVDNNTDLKCTSECLSTNPVDSDSYVYTGPVPTIDIPYKRKSSSKADDTGNVAGTSVAKNSPATAKPNKVRLSLNPEGNGIKETTPLNTEIRLAGTKFTQSTRPQSMMSKRRRLAWTVLMLILAFAVCWTPRYVYFLWYYVYPAGSFNSFWHVFQIVGMCLSFSNSAVNPLVFYILDTKYRSYVHTSLCLLCCKCCRRVQATGSEAVITMGDRDYNATVASTGSKESVTHL